MDHKNFKVNVDFTFAWVLGIVFVVLKLCGVIKWSWVWVTCLFWIPIIPLLIFLAVAKHKGWL